MHLQRLGARIKDRRKQLGVTAIICAEAAGVSRATLHRIEAGNPSVTIGAYLNVANALGTTLTVPFPTEATGDVPMVRVADYPGLRQLAWQIHTATDNSLFRRRHHQRIEHIITSLEPGVLVENQCWLGGGTATSLLKGEYRESVDIDFLVSDYDCQVFRGLDAAVNDGRHLAGRLFGFGRTRLVLGRVVIIAFVATGAIVGLFLVRSFFSGGLGHA